MANEFKIKKGLIVTGANGGTVVDIQGSQGQLFSVTDDLSGSIFAVSDISGVPILDVNSSGISYFDGSLGIGTDNPDVKLWVNDTADGDKIRWGKDNVLVGSIGTYNGVPYIGYQGGTGGGIMFNGASIEPTLLGNSRSNNTNDIGSTTYRWKDGWFAGQVTAVEYNLPSGGMLDWANGDARIVEGLVNNYSLSFQTWDGSTLNTALRLDGNNDATFATQAFATTATSSGDASSTLTTKGYVDGLITGATIYRGAWDPSGGGYGSPDLSGVAQTSGYYYICSAAGAAEPNGTGTEPDTWETGDWVIYNDVSGTGQWQKIDNSSVLSGVGTGQTVALWEGAGSVTDSETLGNAPITVSGSDTTFSGTSTFGGDLYLTTNTDILKAGTNPFRLFTDGTLALSVSDSQNATFAGTVTAADLLTVSGDGHLFLGADEQTPKIDMMYDDHASGIGWDTRIFIGKTDDLPNGQGFPTSTIAGGYGTQYQANSDGAFFGIIPYTAGHYRPVINWGDDVTDSPFSFQFNGTNVVNISTGGGVGANSFTGDHIGTINTATTGVTQTAGDNSTLIATTAYADAAASAVDPSGVYLPLAGGTLTGGLVGTSANFGDGVKSSDGFFNNISGIRLLYPKGGSNNALGNAGTTGALKITLPQGWTNTMMRMTIKVYEYSTSKSFTINCGGYNYGSGSGWLNEFAYIESQSEVDRNFTVRFGYDSNNKCCIYIGELASVWSYPKVFVTDFEAGFNNTTASNWQDGWVISMETTAFENVSKTRTNCQINNWKRNGQDVYYGSGTGRVGIGTTIPSEKLEVDGNVQIGSTTDAKLYMVSTGGNGNNERFFIEGYADGGTYGGGFKLSTRNDVNVFNTTVTVNRNGNVGIGTTDPSARLDVVGNGNAIQIRRAGGYASIKAHSDQGGNLILDSTSPGAVFINHYVNRPVYIATGGGNVGIGTDSPGSLLSLRKDDSTLYDPSSDDGQRAVGATILLNNNDTTTNTFGQIMYDTDSSGQGVARIVFLDAGTASSAIAFVTEQSDSIGERMRIDSIGNVGIGTSTPNAKLDVQGTQGQLFSVTDDLSGDIFSVADISGVPIMNVNSDGTSYFDSNVGIGTYSPWNIGAGYTGLTIDDTTTGFLALRTSGTTKLVLSANGNSYLNGGNVGIGTTSPSSKLYVANANTSQNQLALAVNQSDPSSAIATFYQAGIQTHSFTTTGTNSGILQIKSGGNNIVNISTSGYSYFNGGNVGIGTTTPEANLEISGANAVLRVGPRYTAGGDRDFIDLIADGSNSKILSNNEKFHIENNSGDIIINPSGSVGIGTTSPGAKLGIRVNGIGNSAGNESDSVIFQGDRHDWIFKQIRTAATTDWNSTTLRLQTRVDSTNMSSIDFVTDASYNRHIDINTASNTFSTRFAHNGNVGIGTTGPSTILEVKGTIPTPNRTVPLDILTITGEGTNLPYTGSGGGIVFKNRTYNYGLLKSARIRSYVDADSASNRGAGLIFEVTNSNQTYNPSLFLKYDGNVGIGTTSPGEKLVVNGATLMQNTTGPIKVKVNSGFKSWIHHVSANDDYVIAPSATDGGEDWSWNSGFNFSASGNIMANNFILRSDERLKTKITDLSGDNIDVRWKSFELKSDEGNYRTGVIAQELERTNPEFVDTDDKGFKSVKYIDLLIAKIAELEARLEKLEK